MMSACSEREKEMSSKNSAPPNACFGILASIWVSAYEYVIPSAYQIVAHGHNLDELRESVTRLHNKREEVRKRFVSSIADAKKCRKDPKMFRYV